MTAAQPTNEGKQRLVILTWSEYIDPEVVREFEQAFNTEVVFVYFEADDTRTEMLVANDGDGYDVIVINDTAVNDYVKQD